MKLLKCNTTIPSFKVKKVPSPNLLRDIFPFNEVPRLPFDLLAPPIDIPDELFITDTTFRDGMQAREPYTPRQILTLYEYLHKLSGKNGVVRWTEFFLYTKRDREIVRELLELEYEYPRITGWIRASLNDLKLVKSIKLEETGILMSISDYHIFFKLGLSRDTAISKYLEVAEEALKNGIIPRCHLEDVTRADIYGCVLPLVNKLMKLSEKYGVPVKFRLCDTLGLGVPFPYVSLPRSIPKLIYTIRYHCDIPSSWLEFHGHNDFCMAVPNSLASWFYGVSAVNCTLLGIGERCGNTPLEVMLLYYVQLTGDKSIDLRLISEITDYYRNVIKYKVPQSQPLVGERVFSTAAGIHADGLMKNKEVYLPFNVEMILGRQPRVFINDRSGRAGVAMWINTFFNLKGSERVTKDDPGVNKIYNEIMRAYAQGRRTIFSDEEMLALVKKFLPRVWKNANFHR